MKVRRIAKIVIFCIIFLILLNRIYTILSWKDTAGDYYSSVDSFYELDEDIVDVLFFGSSRCYCSIDPSVLWNRHGIGSFSLAISGQDFAGSYYTFKEALKTQKPKVAVVELYGSVFSGYLVEGNLYRTTLPFQISENSYEMVDNLVTEEERKTDFWFRWPILHTRYAELKKEDFQTDRPVYLGYHASFVKQYIGEIQLYQGGEAEPLPEEREQWLQKMIDLAEESGTELCFFIAPYAVTETDQKLFNYVEGIAAEHDIPFLNMLELKDELNINVGEDFSDWAHTNHYGAQKVSKYMADFLAEHYDLEDHRGEEAYALWDENSMVRGREIEVQELKELTSVGEYLEWVSSTRDYTVVAYTAGQHLAPDMDISEELMEAGIGLEFYNAGGMWVYDDGELVYATGEDDALYHQDLGMSNLVVKREAGVNTVLVDKEACQTVTDGINFVVYDKVLGTVVDKAGFWATYSYGLAR